MVCPACGTPAVAGVNFCARCGAGVVANESPYGAPPPPVAGHYGVPDPPSVWLRRNLQPLGILWCVFGAYRVVSGLLGLVFVRAFAGNGWGRHFGNDWGPPHGFWGALLPVLALTTVVYAGFAAFTGWSLLNRKPWGRTLAIIAGVLALFKFPLGTALGIYTLWVLAPRQAGMEWERIADRG